MRGVVAGDDVVATEIVAAGVGGYDVPSGDEQAATRDGGRWNLAITNARRRFHL